VYNKLDLKVFNALFIYSAKACLRGKTRFCLIDEQAISPNPRERASNMYKNLTRLYRTYFQKTCVALICVVLITLNAYVFLKRNIFSYVLTDIGR
jgi:hypothetical protein